MRILIVEDHAELVTMLVRLLETAGYASDCTTTAEDALLVLSYTRYAVVILDLGLPDADGLSVVRKMRARDDRTPVIALTARASVAHRVTGLEAGADDYLAKPFAPEELLARIQALLRRSGTIVDRTIDYGNVSFDPATREVAIGGVPTVLSARELEVLAALIRRSSRVVTKAHLEQLLFGLADDLGSNAVEVYIHRLRRRLTLADADVEIVTVRGVGYMLVERMT
ncbi:response regulator [Sphingomonas faeni]|uniref:response regulator n=1 Tax=Sphingomonas faeni TaxID=185950 RepID=UPI0027813730|nr:response regulator transcription factor [Sphingomonas faeni]MDQ0839963.1 DNA-binding response OmpR family regulator [Sphingomonas faeni]